MIKYKKNNSGFIKNAKKLLNYLSYMSKKAKLKVMFLGMKIFFSNIIIHAKNKKKELWHILRTEKYNSYPNLIQKTLVLTFEKT